MIHPKQNAGIWNEIGTFYCPIYNPLLVLDALTYAKIIGWERGGLDSSQIIWGKKWYIDNFIVYIPGMGKRIQHTYSSVLLVFKEFHFRFFALYNRLLERNVIFPLSYSKASSEIDCFNFFLFYTTFYCRI